MTQQAALERISQALAEQSEELDLSGLELTTVLPEIGQLQLYVTANGANIVSC